MHLAILNQTPASPRDTPLRPDPTGADASSAMASTALARRGQPSRPWEAAGGVGTSYAATASPYSQQTTSAYAQPGGAYGSASYGSSSMYGAGSSGLYGGNSGLYGGSSSMYGGGSSMYGGGGMLGGSSYLGGMGGMYGGSSMYGRSMMGGSMYGGGGMYGGSSMYGGGMAGMYGGGGGMYGGGMMGNQPGMMNLGGPAAPPSAWQAALVALGGVVGFFGRLSFLVDENAHAVHFFISSLLQLLDRAGSLYGEIARFVLRVLLRRKGAPKALPPAPGARAGGPPALPPRGSGGALDVHGGHWESLWR
jgi:peroxin-13